MFIKQNKEHSIEVTIHATCHLPLANTSHNSSSQIILPSNPIFRIINPSLLCVCVLRMCVWMPMIDNVGPNQLFNVNVHIFFFCFFFIKFCSFWLCRPFALSGYTYTYGLWHTLPHRQLNCRQHYDIITLRTPWWHFPPTTLCN